MQQRHQQVSADQRAGQPWPAGAGGGADQQRPLRISGDNGRMGRFLGFLCQQAVVEGAGGAAADNLGHGLGVG